MGWTRQLWGFSATLLPLGMLIIAATKWFSHSGELRGTCKSRSRSSFNPWDCVGSVPCLQPCISRVGVSIHTLGILNASFTNCGWLRADITNLC